MLDVVHGGQPVDVRRRKPRAVLAMLLLHPNQVVSADRLSEGLWGDNAPPTAPNTLQGYVSHLRRALAGPGGMPDQDSVVRTHAPGYMFVGGPDSIDAW